VDLLIILNIKIMKSFLKMLLASTLGVIIAGIVLYLIMFVALISVVSSMGSSPVHVLKNETVLTIDLTGSINDRVNSNPFDIINQGSKKYGLNDIVSAIKKAKDNEKVKGIYLKGGLLSAGFASAEQIRNELKSFKESGKFVIAYGEDFTQNAYFIASVADKIFMNPGGILDFRGLSSNIQYEKGFYEKLGIEWQVFKVGTFKSAVEPYIQDKMSDANREQATSFLNDIWASLLKEISESRGVSVEQLNRYADELISRSDPQVIVDKKLIDGLKFPDEVETYLKEQLGLKEDDKLELASVNNMKSVKASMTDKTGKEKIAVLYAEGLIINEAMPSLLSFGDFIVAKDYVKEINKLKKDENIKAVVLRVNSPGGSAFASEQIHHAIKALNAVKPVVVSMGTYAASGGYYISSGARKIVAEPTTITGSIGIFGLIPSGAQLAKKIGTTYDHVSTNKFSDFGSQTISIPYLGFGLALARPLNAEESTFIQAYIERGYDIFLSRCAEGRGKTKEEIDAIGQGRVWTGNQALNIGLIDKLGGIDDAVEIAAELAEIENYSLKEYPAQKDLFSQFFETSVDDIKVGIVEKIKGKENYRMKQSMESWSKFDFRQAILPMGIN
jgi:protease-4